MSVDGHAMSGSVVLWCVVVVVIITESTPTPTRLEAADRVKRQSDGWCKLPPKPEKGIYSYESSNGIRVDSTGLHVPPGFVLKYSCDAVSAPYNSWNSTCVNGLWDNPQDCQNCGKVEIPVQDHYETLIIHGNATRRGQFPWLAALYYRSSTDKTKWVQRCGGTLITNRIVLTAAHCLILAEGMVGPQELKVGLGKYQRDFYTEESGAIIMNVKKIVTPTNYHHSGYALDIGMLSLTEPVKFTHYIMPACFDWTGTMRLSTGNVGHVGGWGATENGSNSEVVLSGKLLYIPNPLCKQNIRISFTIYVTHDKFCAGAVDGSQVATGDSGGGLTFVKSSRHFIFGVVSARVKQVSTFTLFTDLTNAEHRTWLLQNKIILENDFS